MPGLWELPALRESVIPEARLRLRVRHSIMQVNYNVGIRVVLQEDIAALTVPFAVCRWVRVCDLEGLALTGLARKVLLRSKLPELAPCFGA